MSSFGSDPAFSDFAAKFIVGDRGSKGADKSAGVPVEVIHELTCTRRAIHQLQMENSKLVQEGQVMQQKLVAMEETLQNLVATCASRSQLNSVEFMCRDILGLLSVSLNCPGKASAPTPPPMPPPATQPTPTPWILGFRPSDKPPASAKCDKNKERLQASSAVACDTLRKSVPAMLRGSPDGAAPALSLSDSGLSGKAPTQMAKALDQGVSTKYALPLEYEVQTMVEDKNITVRHIHEEWEDGHPSVDGDSRGIPLKVVAEAAEREKGYQPFGSTKHRRNHMTKWHRHKRIILAILDTSAAIANLEPSLPHRVCRALGVEYWEAVRIAMGGSLYNLREGLAKPTGPKLKKRGRADGSGHGMGNDDGEDDDGGDLDMKGDEKCETDDLMEVGPAIGLDGTLDLLGGDSSRRMEESNEDGGKKVRPKNDRHIRIREKLLAVAPPLPVFLEECRATGLIARLMASCT